MTFPSEHDFALFLFQLFVLLSAAFLLGGLFRRLGQAPVIGEILAGVLLGPSLEYSLINEKVFVALVITAIVTSVMSGPLIQWALRGRAFLEETVLVKP